MISAWTAAGIPARQRKPDALFGGGDYRTGENSAGGRTIRLRGGRSVFSGKPGNGHWSEQDAYDRQVPYIGRFSDTLPDWYVATGFPKWGMTGSMAAARIHRA